MGDFAEVIYPVHYRAARSKMNKVLGITPEAEQANLQMEMRESGVSDALVMLVHALEEAKPGDRSWS